MRSYEIMEFFYNFTVTVVTGRAAAVKVRPVKR